MYFLELLRVIFNCTMLNMITKYNFSKKKSNFFIFSLFYSRRYARRQLGQFLHYNGNSLYNNEKMRTKKNHVKCVNLQVHIFQAKKIKSLSLLATELLQLKNPLKN